MLAVIGPVGEELQREKGMGSAALAKIQTRSHTASTSPVVILYDNYKIHCKPAENTQPREMASDPPSPARRCAAA